MVLPVGIRTLLSEKGSPSPAGILFRPRRGSIPRRRISDRIGSVPTPALGPLETEGRSPPVGQAVPAVPVGLPYPVPRPESAAGGACPTERSRPIPVPTCERNATALAKSRFLHSDIKVRFIQDQFPRNSSWPGGRRRYNRARSATILPFWLASGDLR